MKNILIGGAWPYANGSLHIGHIAGLLPGDVLARYHRAIGDNVYFVSGSDCHGTPVAIRAKKEGKTPQEISDHYHEEFTECFRKLGFSYDVYTKTSAKEHKDFVKDFHENLYKSEYVYEKETPQAYCDKCDIFLADRFVIGKCPKCGEDARGEQCDACGAVLEAENLLEPACAICGRPISFRSSKHLYIAISKLKNQLKELVDGHSEWRKNAIAFTNRYIDEGLRDRALTRNLDWGISVPKDDYQDKTIYIWAENVLGYLSASKIAADRKGDDFEALWGEDAKHYYVHGKDNIPFHTIWVKDLLDSYEPDSIRYYFLANGPEKKDADFSWRDYVYSHNGELLGAYGNFINRSLSFINKYWDGIIPEGIHDAQINKKIEELYAVTGKLIEKGAFKDAINGIFDFVRAANKYFDTQKPWITRDTDEAACKNTLYQCVQIIANLAVILYPFLPFSSEKVCKWLQLDNVWEPQSVPAGYHLPEIEILFNRIDKNVIGEETEKLDILLENAL